MEYWCINDDYKPQWVQDLINRGLLIHRSTYITDCYIFKQTLFTTSPIYLYDGDGLCFEEDTIGVVYNLYFHSFKELKENVEMIKYYCDICGKEIFDPEDICHLKLTKRTSDYSNINICKNICKDICEKCCTKIEDITKRRVKN